MIESAGLKSLHPSCLGALLELHITKPKKILLCLKSWEHPNKRCYGIGRTCLYCM